MQFHNQIEISRILVDVQKANNIGVLDVSQDIDLHGYDAHFRILSPSVDRDFVSKYKLDGNFFLVRVSSGRDYKSEPTGSQFVPKSVFFIELRDEGVVLQMAGRDCQARITGIMMLNRILLVGRRGGRCERTLGGGIERSVGNGAHDGGRMKCFGCLSDDDVCLLRMENNGQRA